jgi:Asp-tRNA(Asn)/Glu-tRNA(Gln) amidotransferase A subunit family amidase
VKDNIDALPHPTTAACDAFRYTPQRSAVTVAALENEGACMQYARVARASAQRQSSVSL